MAIENRYATMPFAEAIAYLSERINLPTDSWRDIADDEHDVFFVVAGAKGSLLAELRTAVDKAIADGLRPEEFQAQFEKIAEGWDYNGDAAWRSRIIYQANLRASYGRGREEYQLDPEVLKAQPFLQYIHGDSRAPRPNHLALDGKVFRGDSLPWALPSGYGCSCRYVSLSQRDLDREGLSVTELARGDTVQVEMPDGQTRTTTLESDRGWDRAPGRARGERRQEIYGQVLGRLPAEIAGDVAQDVARYERENGLV
jgi:uncharacterized protein with gpF-like domain